ncbi:MAG: hypothetical protein GY820_34605 [Gammaproteobacteria bacterium]|nr:hypothetical protein [Gammaproteobacteria bacterium]
MNKRGLNPHSDLTLPTTSYYATTGTTPTVNNILPSARVEQFELGRGLISAKTQLRAAAAPFQYLLRVDSVSLLHFQARIIATSGLCVRERS